MKYKIEVCFSSGDKFFFGAFRKKLFGWERMQHIDSDTDQAVVERRLNNFLALETPRYFDATGKEITDV